jgi:hypothetical protein
MAKLAHRYSSANNFRESGMLAGAGASGGVVGTAAAASTAGVPPTPGKQTTSAPQAVPELGGSEVVKEK